MKPYPCPNCGRPNHFEVRVCPRCSFTLGYDPATDQFLFLGDEATTWRDSRGDAHEVVVCANNNRYGICNWLVPAVGHQPLCLACKHNRTIPDLTGPNVPERWAKIEAAKRRLFHTWSHLGLPAETMMEAAAKGTCPGLAFDFLYDPVGEQTGTVQIPTGHEAGVITLNLIEADDAAGVGLEDFDDPPDADADVQEGAAGLAGGQQRDGGQEVLFRMAVTIAQTAGELPVPQRQMVVVAAVGVVLIAHAFLSRSSGAVSAARAAIRSSAACSFGVSTSAEQKPCSASTAAADIAW